jgi:hypothetical protein
MHGETIKTKTEYWWHIVIFHLVVRQRKSLRIHCTCFESRPGKSRHQMFLTRSPQVHGGLLLQTSIHVADDNPTIPEPVQPLHL